MSLTSSRRKRAILAIFAFTVLYLPLSIASRFWTVRLQIKDTGLYFDEGLVVSSLPISPLAKNQATWTGVSIFHRTPDTHWRFHWTSGKRHMIPIREFIPWARSQGNSCRLFAGFGYETDPDNSGPRPGRSLTLILPIWFILLSTVAPCAYCWRITFGLRFLLVLTTLAGILIWAVFRTVGK